MANFSNQIFVSSVDQNKPKTLFFVQVKNSEDFRKTQSQHPHGVIFDNIPTKGFKINGVESTYSNKNKWFQVIDPRGFIEQVSADNLVDIMKHTGVDKGELTGEYVWGKQGGWAFLARLDHPELVKYLNPVADPIVNPGDYVKSNYVDGVYCGTFYVMEYTERLQYPPGYSYWNSRNNGVQPKQIPSVKMSKDRSKLVYRDTNKHKYYDFVKSFGKDHVVASTNNNFPKFENGYVIYEYSNMKLLFVTKQAMLNFDQTKLADLYKQRPK
jgi:hypothetical protein